MLFQHGRLLCCCFSFFLISVLPLHFLPSPSCRTRKPSRAACVEGWLPAWVFLVRRALFPNPWVLWGPQRIAHLRMTSWQRRKQRFPRSGRHAALGFITLLRGSCAFVGPSFLVQRGRKRQLLSSLPTALKPMAHGAFFQGPEWLSSRCQMYFPMRPINFNKLGKWWWTEK